MLLHYLGHFHLDLIYLFPPTWEKIPRITPLNVVERGRLLKKEARHLKLVLQVSIETFFPLILVRRMSALVQWDPVYIPKV
jgi:hypothetical protein